jgi:hypothetical protein
MTSRQGSSQDEIQALCLERTDKLLDDLCAVFDAAETRAVASNCKDGEALTIMLGACSYAVGQVLAPCPSVKLFLFFERVKRLTQMLPHVSDGLGPGAAATLDQALNALTSRLLAMATPYKGNDDCSSDSDVEMEN